MVGWMNVHASTRTSTSVLIDERRPDGVVVMVMLEVSGSMVILKSDGE